MQPFVSLAASFDAPLSLNTNFLGSFPFELYLFQDRVPLAMPLFAVPVLLRFLAPCRALDATPTKLTMGTENIPIPGKIVYTFSAPLHFVLPNFTNSDPHVIRAIDFLRAHISGNFDASCTLASRE